MIKISLYKRIKEINPASFVILPMLDTKKYIDYPGFMNCYATDNNEICIYTEIMESLQDTKLIEEIFNSNPYYIRTEDNTDKFNYTRSYFSIPSEWQEDFSKIVSGRLKYLSEGYKTRLIEVYPELDRHFPIIFG